MPEVVTVEQYKCSKCAALYDRETNAEACEAAHQLLTEAAQHRSACEKVTAEAQRICPHGSFSTHRATERLGRNMVDDLCFEDTHTCNTCGHQWSSTRY